MNSADLKLRRGDFVEVRPPDEIARTLDADGSVDDMPFMPEMLELCGQRYRVSARALTVCYSGEGGTSRGFRSDKFVTLDGVRCSGAAHGGCQKACTIFWHESWLRKVECADGGAQEDMQGTEPLQSRLKIASSPKTYYCQATELIKATTWLSFSGRLRRSFSALGVGNFSVWALVRSVPIWLFWSIRRRLFGAYVGASSKASPVDSLNLQAGEWVEVKPLESIIETLDENGENRGLRFTPDMGLKCGQRFRVKGRLEKMVVDGTGQMRQLRHTVCLEGSTCGCFYMGLGMTGCSRCEYNYWREVWLQRCSEGNQNA